MLDAEYFIAAGGEDVCQEGIFGELDGVAVIEDRNRQLDHAGVRLQFLVAPDGDIELDRTIVARSVIEGDRLVADRPFARGEIGHREQRANRNQNRNSTFHVRPRSKASSPGFQCSGTLTVPLSLLSLNIRHTDVTGSPKVVN